MASVKVVNKDGGDAGSMDLNDAVFGVQPNPTLVHQVVVAMQAAKRQGNAETKNRSQVAGGGQKPFRQKGTGNARRGSIREPHLRGGGVVFGPHKRSYRQDLPVKSRRKALCCMLSERVRSNTLRVLDSLVIEQPKTKPFAQLVANLGAQGKKTLFITSDSNDNTLLSARNLPKVEIRTAADLNALDVLQASEVVLVGDAVDKLQERLT
ncbi:MAG: 50S ribosomal protein L4 [Candidatus Hydrogenedentes bacterium]|nr:50S ribosomal protein L4 [Candidatus Hydrogenedentota bacterium]